MSIGEKIDQLYKEERQLDLSYNSRKKEIASEFIIEIERYFLDRGCEIPKVLFRAESTFNGFNSFSLFKYKLIGIKGYTVKMGTISRQLSASIRYETTGWLKSDVTIEVSTATKNAIVSAMKRENLFFTAEEATDDAIRQLKVPPYE